MVMAFARKVFGLVVLVLIAFSTAEAAEIRVVDSTGLVRAVRVVQQNSRIVIAIKGGVQGECVATNVDGLSAEKRVAVSSKGECIFTDMPEGSWQVAVPGKATWQAKIYE
jgi:hypothetical protein